jgi:hypothetical protein
MSDKKVELTPADQLYEDWKPVVEHADLEPITDNYRKRVTAVMLNNQQMAMDEEREAINEVPANITGGGTVGGTSTMRNWDPVLISMVRRAAPKMMAFDVFGVQPMKGPTGLIFSMASTYDGPAGAEALHNEADSNHSSDLGSQGDNEIGNGTPDVSLTNPYLAACVRTNYGAGVGAAVTDFEQAGDTDYEWSEMGFNIKKSSVIAKSRGLRATYSVELAQDLKAIHGLNADGELANILSTEILAEMNREVMRTMYFTARTGCLAATGLASDGVFDLDVDSNGRWSVERFKGLMFQIEREANSIAYLTKRGKGNFIVCSADVASALSMTGLLENNPTSLNGQVDTTGSTFVGTLNGRTKVFVDPYVTGNGVTIGYKGANQYDAGAFYCPYVPLTLYRATTEEGFQPRLGFKSRYGMVQNPFANSDRETATTFTAGSTSAGNPYFRMFQVTNLV